MVVNQVVLQGIADYLGVGVDLATQWSSTSLHRLGADQAAAGGYPGGQFNRYFEILALNWAKI